MDADSLLTASAEMFTVEGEDEDQTVFILRYIDRLWIRDFEFLKERALNCVGR